MKATTSSLELEAEYESFQQFFTERIGRGMEKLERSKINSLCVTWTKNRQTRNLFLHAEMQLVLFYALNPHLSPLNGYIGVSKKCCWSCDFQGIEVGHISHILAITTDIWQAYDVYIAGNPLLFSVQGTHKRKPAQRVFPDPSKHHGLIDSDIDVSVLSHHPNSITDST
jgi:OTT_1508-like deaminase